MRRLYSGNASAVAVSQRGIAAETERRPAAPTNATASPVGAALAAKCRFVVRMQSGARWRWFPDFIRATANRSSRSEERRVGKEGRSRAAACHEEKDRTAGPIRNAKP